MISSTLFSTLAIKRRDPRCKTHQDKIKQFPKRCFFATKEIPKKKAIFMTYFIPSAFRFDFIFASSAGVGAMGDLLIILVAPFFFLPGLAFGSFWFLSKTKTAYSLTAFGFGLNIFLFLVLLFGFAIHDPDFTNILFMLVPSLCIVTLSGHLFRKAKRWQNEQAKTNV
jgi:hypothetical protein